MENEKEIKEEKKEQQQEEVEKLEEEKPVPAGTSDDKY